MRGRRGRAQGLVLDVCDSHSRGSAGALSHLGDIVEILTAKEVADKLKLSVRTIHKLTQTGEIPHRKIGGAYRYKDSEIMDWFEGLPQN